MEFRFRAVDVRPPTQGLSSSTPPDQPLQDNGSCIQTHGAVLGPSDSGQCHTQKEFTTGPERIIEELRRYVLQVVDERLSLAGIGGSTQQLVPKQSATEVVMNQQSPIMLAKSDRHLPKTNGKKGVTPSKTSAGQILFAEQDKILEEWSCALCRFSGENEKGLSVHLQSEMHKGKEEALKASILDGKKRKAEEAILDAATRRERKRKVNLLCTEIKSSSQEQQESSKIEGQPHDAILDAATRRKRKRRGKSLPTAIKSSSEEQRESSKIEGQPHEEKYNHAEKKENTETNKTEYFCDICQVYVPSLKKVMDDHVNGKRHINRAHASKEAVSGTETMTTGAKIKQEANNGHSTTPRELNQETTVCTASDSRGSRETPLEIE